MDKTTIKQQLTERHQVFVDFIFTLSETDFLYAPPGKWNAGQQLEHIYKSVRPVKLAFLLPRFLLSLLFGKTNRPSKNYNDLVNKYKEKLAKGGKAPAPFIPSPVLFIQRETLNNKLTQVIHSLNYHLNKYSEAELDLYILPHPLLGKLTLREMLYFTMYHVEHHHQFIIKGLQQNDLDKNPA